MKALTLLFVFISLICTNVLSQHCLPDGISFTSQEQIDNFQTNYPNCTQIEGSVWIGENISNLNGFNALTSFGGDLWLLETNLSNLAGLDNITAIQGGLHMMSNNALTNIESLSNVTSIGGFFSIDDNNSLKSLVGLNKITSIEGNFIISRNDSLMSINSLSNLTIIGGHFTIRDNAFLTSLSGLENVTSIHGKIVIDYNSNLITITGIDKINSESITDLHITENYSLSMCEAQSVCNYLASPNGVIDVYNNATGCNNKEEVIAACIDWIPYYNSETNITIYPNPAKKELFILSENEISVNEVNIFNQLGLKLLHEAGNTDKINISTLRPGIYIIEIITENIKIRKNLIINK